MDSLRTGCPADCLDLAPHGVNPESPDRMEGLPVCRIVLPRHDNIRHNSYARRRRARKNAPERLFIALAAQAAELIPFLAAILCIPPMTVHWGIFLAQILLKHSPFLPLFLLSIIDIFNHMWYNT